MSLGDSPSQERVAVVGIACRLPQAPGPAAFWDLLRSERSAITAPPPAAGTKPPTHPLFGGFLDDVDGFDPEFFGISPARRRRWTPSSASPSNSPGRHSRTPARPGPTRKQPPPATEPSPGQAQGLPPELPMESLLGLPPDLLAGQPTGSLRGPRPGPWGDLPRDSCCDRRWSLSRDRRRAFRQGHQRSRPGISAGVSTGVFVGAIASDYATLVARGGPAAVTRHTLTGLNRGLIANRVSHALGLRGPSLTVDSAQSSSLVAVHLAAESVRSGESAIAIAAGVHLNLSTDGAVAAGRFGALSPDGRCYTFDARANGYVRGEGGVALVLKTLTRALADGDRIYALISGGAVNNDGHTAGLTVPDPTAQAEVISLALARAGFAPDQVQYVELHGTGTKVGDPIEAAAPRIGPRLR